MNILLLNYYSRNSLAVLHGLAGNHSIVGADQAASHLGHRRWERLLRYRGVQAIERYAPPDDNPERFRDDVVRICERHSIGLVIPTGTTSTNALSRDKVLIEERTGARCAVTHYEQLRGVTDKWHAYGLALEAGVPVPETRLFDPHFEAPPQVTGMTYPLVVKPRISYAAIGVHHVYDERQLVSLGKRLAAETSSRSGTTGFIVQQQIEGALHDAASFAQGGRPLALVTQQRVVALYDFGGGGIVNLTTRDELLAKHARKFLDRVQWDGPMLFDFVRTAEGQVYLIECNPKIWGTTDLALEAGADVVSAMVDVFGHGRRPDAPLDCEYEAGVLYRWWFPECVYHWFNRPLTPGRVFTRVRRTLARHDAQRVVSNLRRRDLTHLVGIAVNHLGR